MNKADLTEQGMMEVRVANIVFPSAFTINFIISYICIHNRLTMFLPSTNYFPICEYLGTVQGVFDSDVFILFLTCSVLSRK